MTEEVNPETNQKYLPLLVVGGLMLFTIIANFIPGSWFGIKPLPSSHVRLDLDKLASISSFNASTQGVGEDGVTDWDKFVSSTYDGNASTSADTTLDPQALQALNDPTNLTGSFSKNLYLASAYLDQKGITDEASQQQVVGNLLSQEQPKLTSVRYSLQDITIAKTETRATQKIYGNAVAKILQGIVTEQIITNDIQSINTYTQSKAKKDLSTLSKNKIRIDGILQKLLALPTPPSAATYQLLAITRIAGYRDVLDSLSKADTDPIRSLLAFQSYSDITILVLRLQGQFTNYFNNENVVFSAQDAGYLFTAGYTSK